MASNRFFAGDRTTVGLVWAALLLVAVLATAGARAASAAASTAPPRPYDAAQLEELVGPIALYADDLIGIVLPASAYPLQIVEAARFLDARQNDSSLTPDEDWDDAVVALLNYPEVLRQLNDDLDWTAGLGEAFVYQQADVLEAIQRFRERARTAGNLNSDEHQNVSEVDGAIEIAPADPEVIYVPYYEPARVVSYYAGPAYDYYPYAYPVYYYPYPYGYAFNSGFFWGVTTAYFVGWNDHHVRVCPYNYRGHPYYGHRYHDGYYTRRTHGADVSTDRHGNAWRPGDRWGGRPRQQHHDQDRYVGTGRPATVDGRGPAPMSPAGSAAGLSARTLREPGSRESDMNSLAGRGGWRTDVRTVSVPAGNAAGTRYRRAETDSSDSRDAPPRAVRGPSRWNPVSAEGQNVRTVRSGGPAPRAPADVPTRGALERYAHDRVNARAAPPVVRTDAPRQPAPAAQGGETLHVAAGPARGQGDSNSSAPRGAAWRQAPTREAGPASSGAAPRQAPGQHANGRGESRGRR